jgi:hypothetical protein
MKNVYQFALKLAFVEKIMQTKSEGTKAIPWAIGHVGIGD